MSSVNRSNYTISHFLCFSLLSFISCIDSFLQINSIEDIGHSCLLLDFSVNASNISPLGKVMVYDGAMCVCAGVCSELHYVKESIPILFE